MAIVKLEDFLKNVKRLNEPLVASSSDSAHKNERDSIDARVGNAASIPLSAANFAGEQARSESSVSRTTVIHNYGNYTEIHNRGGEKKSENRKQEEEEKKDKLSSEGQILSILFGVGALLAGCGVLGNQVETYNDWKNLKQQALSTISETEYRYQAELENLKEKVKVLSEKMENKYAWRLAGLVGAVAVAVIVLVGGLISSWPVVAVGIGVGAAVGAVACYRFGSSSSRNKAIKEEAKNVDNLLQQLTAPPPYSKDGDAFEAVNPFVPSAPPYKGE